MLIKVCGTSLTVAKQGVALPFALGVAACLLPFLVVGFDHGRDLDDNSVGTTVFMLADLGRLRDLECQIILCAAVVIDDVLA